MTTRSVTSIDRALADLNVDMVTTVAGFGRQCDG